MTFGPGSTYGEDGAGAAGAYYVVTWIGIVVMVAVLVYWVYWENRRLHAHDWIRAAAPAPSRPTEDTTMDDDNRQIEFPPLQTHSRGSSA